MTSSIDANSAGGNTDRKIPLPFQRDCDLDDHFERHLTRPLEAGYGRDGDARRLREVGAAKAVIDSKASGSLAEADLRS